jgi:hypothetical protein
MRSVINVTPKIRSDKNGNSARVPIRARLSVDLLQRTKNAKLGLWDSGPPARKRSVTQARMAPKRYHDGHVSIPRHLAEKLAISFLIPLRVRESRRVAMEAIINPNGEFASRGQSEISTAGRVSARSPIECGQRNRVLVCGIRLPLFVVHSLGWSCFMQEFTQELQFVQRKEGRAEF